MVFVLACLAGSAVYVSMRGKPQGAGVVLAYNKGGEMSVHFSSRSDNWETPSEFFSAVEAELGLFTVDVCATAANAKVAQFYTPEQDGRKQVWTGRCWMNPPYGRGIGAWVKKASESAKGGAVVVALLPARTDTGWAHEYIFKAGSCASEVRFIRGRLKFGGGENSAPFPSMLVIFEPLSRHHLNVPLCKGWEWK